METQVRNILRSRSGLGDKINDIGVHENLWIMGMTSLASVDVMVALEETYGFEFPESRLRHATFASIANIVACVSELAGSPAQ